VRVRERLRAIYGIPLMRPHRHPIAELVLTVLSQSTNDRNRDVAYLGLRERFATWQEVMRAPLGEIEEAIRPGGISKVKSQRIKAILTAIAERGPTGAADPQPPSSGKAAHARAHTRARGPSRKSSSDPSQAPSLDRSQAPSPDRSQAPSWGSSREAALDCSQEPSLDWLPDVPLIQARDYLVGLPGVGRKTAACVLLFAFGLREVPVDTHVSRVGMRLELLRPGAPFHELHDQMLALTPPGQELELHVNLLRHGRRTCHARRPDCAGCALARMCPSRGLFD
jgi:endonuclease III